MCSEFLDSGHVKRNHINVNEFPASIWFHRAELVSISISVFICQSPTGGTGNLVPQKYMTSHFKCIYVPFVWASGAGTMRGANSGLCDWTDLVRLLLCCWCAFATRVRQSVTDGKSDMCFKFTVTTVFTSDQNLKISGSEVNFLWGWLDRKSYWNCLSVTHHWVCDSGDW